MKTKKVKLNEVRGIAESTIPYTHAILNILDKHIENFIAGIQDEEYLDSTKDLRGALPDYTTTIIIPYRHFAKYIVDDIFEDFPLVKLTLDVKMTLINEEWEGSFDSVAKSNFIIGGGAYTIRNKPTLGNASYRIKPENFPISKNRRESIDRALVGSMEIDIVINHNFNFESEMGALHTEITSTVFHEMEHLYEEYKDRSRDVRVVRPETLKTTKVPKPKTQIYKSDFDKIKFIGIPSDVKKYMRNLLFYYYWTSPDEVKAITHEMYPYVLDNSVDEFFETFQGVRIKNLMDFDYEFFYDELITYVMGYYNSKGLDLNEEQMNAFFEQIRKRIIKTFRNQALSNHELFDEKIAKQKDLKSLIGYMGKQIEKGGKRLFRNVGRLYSLKQEANG